MLGDDWRNYSQETGRIPSEPRASVWFKTSLINLDTKAGLIPTQSWTRRRVGRNDKSSMPT